MKTLQEIAGNPDLLKGYTEWLANPITRMVLDMARNMAVPATLRTLTGESALYNYGFVEGMNAVISMIGDVQKFAELETKVRLAAEAPDYGVATILKEKYGYE